MSGMVETTRDMRWHTHNWYPVAVQGQPPTDEWVCIVQGCGYRMMPPTALAAHDAQVRAEALAPIEALVRSPEADKYRAEACRGVVALPYASNRYIRLLDDIRAAMEPKG